MFLVVIMLHHEYDFLCMLMQKWCNMHHLSWGDDNSQETQLWASVSRALPPVMVRETTHMSYLQSPCCTTWKWDWTTGRCSTTRLSLSFVILLCWAVHDSSPFLSTQIVGWNLVKRNMAVRLLLQLGVTKFISCLMKWMFLVSLMRDLDVSNILETMLPKYFPI